MKKVFILSLIISIALVALLWFLDINAVANRISFLSFIVLLLTFIGLLWYADETSKLRKEAQKQTDFEMRPFLRLQYDGLQERVFTLANDGRGLARDVVFEPFVYGPRDHEINVQIKSRPVVSSKGSTAISEDELFDSSDVWLGQDNRSFALARNIGRFYGEQFQIKATYKDLEDNSYEVIFEADKSYNDGFKIVYQDRVQ